MDLRHARTFVTVAELGTVSKAALRLRTAQPALSRQIRDLEQELGLRLFDRIGRRLRLTGGGQGPSTAAPARRNSVTARHVERRPSTSNRYRMKRPHELKCLAGARRTISLAFSTACTLLSEWARASLVRVSLRDAAHVMAVERVARRTARKGGCDMNPYTTLSSSLGHPEAADLVARLSAWHDAMVAHERRLRAGTTSDGCHDECPHAEARSLWSEAVATIGARAQELTFLRSRAQQARRSMRWVARAAGGATAAPRRTAPTSDDVGKTA